ncbi:hypothetical protein AB1K32_00170 [Metabacillus dongyingensis]|uniref:hypothetical protein n=1 Tax=Metabacillus dongyingensis TaxID=2874282 RepID=UPI003B8B9351
MKPHENKKKSSIMMTFFLFLLGSSRACKKRLKENMGINEQRKITITIGMESVKELADMNGFSWL